MLNIYPGNSDVILFCVSMTDNINNILVFNYISQVHNTN